MTARHGIIVKWREITLLVLAGNGTYLALPLLLIAFVRSEKKTGKMVGLQYDCLQNPLGAVRLTFEKAVASGSDPATFNGKDWGATTIFRDFLIDKGCLSQVFSLSKSLDLISYTMFALEWRVFLLIETRG